MNTVASNYRINPTVRPVTPLACASVAPGRPARYALRSQDSERTTMLQAVLWITLLATAADGELATTDPLNGEVIQDPLGHDGPMSLCVSKVDGVDRTTTVDEQLLSTSPRWLPGTPIPELPLGIAEAVKLSQGVLSQTVRDPSKWGIGQVASERFGLSCLYVVRWRPIAGGNNDCFQIPVLMTGRAIPLDQLAEPRK